MSRDLWFNILQPEAAPLAYIDAKKLKGKRGVGCNGCPQAKHEKQLLGLDLIKGRKAMLWGLSPEKDDERKGANFTGPVGKWVWRELARVGLERKDFDLQNVVRCRVEGSPSPLIQKQCSFHSDQALALNGGHASVHIIFGSTAASALLGIEYKKDRPCFWSEKLAAMIYVLDHPRRFMDSEPAPWRIEEFRLRLKAAAWQIKHPERHSFVMSLDVKMLTKASSVRAFLEEAKASGQRVAIDIEDGMVRGKRRILCIGFSYKKRSARVVMLDHPENPNPGERKGVLAALEAFLTDPGVEKVFQYGSHDADQIEALLGFPVKGYTFDTLYAHYLRYTFLKSHGLETIASLHYPLYAGYKDLVAPYVKGPDPNYANIPLKKIVRYNGADACLTKEIELQEAPHISLPLLQIYCQAGLTLKRMEGRGPVMDRVYFDEVRKIVPKRLRRIESELRALADNPRLNLNTPQDVAKVIYDDLGLPDLNEGRKNARSTRENVIELLIQQTDHPFLKGLLEYRKLSKMESTYLRGYKVSADMHGGELRTRWHLAGAITGRLRSGGGKEAKGVINMQNLHGSPFLQNLIASDPEWRLALPIAQALSAIDPTSKAGKALPAIPEEVLDLDVLLAFDYSQIEIRMLAECSGDATLIQQFKEGQDIHCAVGATLNPKWSFEFIKKDKPTRTFIKNCHFGMVYGLDEEGLFYYLKAKGIKTSMKKVAAFHRAYFKKYAGVARFIVDQRAFAVEHGYVETMFGFRRLVGSDADEERQTNPENQAVNSPIQGSAHTLLLAAMALLSHRPKRYHLLQAPLMEVHDALVFRVKLRDLPQAYAMAKQLLEKDAVAYIKRLFGIELQVPLLSEGSAGFQYGTMVELEEPSIHRFLAAWAKKYAEVDKKISDEYRVAA